MRVAHILPCLEVGGMEQVAMDLCVHGRAQRVTPFVAAWEDGPMANAFRRQGIPTWIGAAGVRTAGMRSDLIHLHAGEFSANWMAIPQQIGKPWLVTLHCWDDLPAMPAVVACTSRALYAAQTYRRRCVCIPNGVDTERFALPRSTSGREIVVTRICRPERCASYFWAAMREAFRREASLRLWIVGSDAAAAAHDPRVRFLGVRRDTPEILGRSDIFVYTPYPRVGTRDLVVMEACAAGVPVVASDSQATRETIVDGVNGFLTPYGDIEALTEKVLTLAVDARLREEMGLRARQMAREQFDVRNTARHYAMLYRSVLRTGARIPAWPSSFGACLPA